MKFAALIPLVGAIINLSLAVLVLFNNARAVVNRVCCLLSVCFAVWNFGTFWMFRVEDAPMALFWARFLQFGVIFIPVSFFHLSLLLARVKVGRYIYAFYAMSVLLALSNFTPLFLKNVRYVGYAWYSVAGPAFWVLVCLYTTLWLSILILIRERRKSPPILKKRLTPLIWAQIAITFFGDNDLLPILGVDYYPIIGHQIYPFGSMAAIFYGIVVGYSVLQHQILDVRLTLSQVVAKTVRITFICLIGLGVLLIFILIGQLTTWGQFNIFGFVGAVVALITGAICAATLFPRLFGSATESMERIILGDRLEYHDQIRGFVSTMQWYNDTDLLLSDLHQLLIQTVRVRSYQIILRDETNRAYSLFRSYPSDPIMGQMPELRSDSPVFRFFEVTGAEYLGFHMIYGIPEAMELEERARVLLKHFDAEFCLPFMSEEEPFGLLLLGPKRDEEPYTATDIGLLVSLVRNLSLIINQNRLKTQVLQAQELELLGRMSRGMAHDLNNLVTPIRTLLQLMNEGISAEDLREELLPVALRSIETMREYVREALFFSENSRPDFKLGRLDMLLSEVVDITAPRRSPKSINVAVETPGEVLAEMDKSLIQRMITNVVANAIDASPSYSTIRIELVRLLKTEAQRDWLRVRIIDSGEGIKPENLQRIFTPYFTTKDRGDQTRGFGLGLSICRKIVQLHGGFLNVFSQLRKGTTVQIDLPDRQIRPATTMTGAPAINSVNSAA